ncbi:MAG TPA: hypothetical protein VND40_00280 [Nitrososphaerales archaeon]|nr:hypothetical protein [Nitrososphaerales archaeon]
MWLESRKALSKWRVHTRINKSYWDYIVNVKHPSVRGLEQLVQSSLTEPIEVRRSRRDQSVHLHYGRFEAKLLVCTVVKFLNGDGFVITAYLTRRMIGDSIWKQKQ